MRISESLATVLLLLTGLRAQEHTFTPPPALKQLSSAIHAVVARVSPSIVRIEVVAYASSSDSQRSETHLITKSESIASGVILDPNGYIVTNAHVVEGARRIRVVLDQKAHAASGSTARYQHGSETFDARVMGVFAEADLAVLKIDTTGLPAVTMADSDLVYPGELVLAFGNPEGLDNSVSMGVISAVGRESEEDRPPVYIQTDAAINQGSSGGALVDINGQLLGITSFILTEGGGSEGLGFALPSNLVNMIAGELKSKGRFCPGQIGLRVQEITAAMAAGLRLPRNSGLIVSDVLPGSSAESVGVQVQDLVVSLDTTPIETVAQFVTAFYMKRAGERVQLHMLRGARSYTAIVQVREGTEDVNGSARSTDDQKSMIRSLCVTATNLDEKTRSTIPQLRSTSGVMVVDRLAQCDIRTGIEPGDIIRSVNNTKVIDIDGIRAQLLRLNPGDALALQVERHNKLRFLAFEFE